MPSTRILCLALFLLSGSRPGIAHAAQEEQIEDFESAAAPNVIYPGWEAVRSPDHPTYNRITLERDAAAARSGRQFLRMTTLGRNTAFRMLAESAWKVDPGRSYRLTAWARLSGTKRNAASVTMTWIDGQSRVLGEDTSGLLGGPCPWTLIPFDVPRVPREAARVRVRLNFEGPDVRGICDFDRVSLRLQPFLELRPKGRMLPVFEPKTKPCFTVTVLGLAPGDHAVEVTTKDGGGHEAARVARRAASSGSTLQIEFAEHAPGAYEAHAVLVSVGGKLAETSCPLLVPNPPWLGPSPAPGIGGIFDPFETDYLAPAELARLAGFKRAKVYLWDSKKRARRGVDESQLLDLVRDLSQVEGMTLTGVVPPADGERKSWEESVRPLKKRFAEFIPFWQIGDDDSSPIVRTDDLLKLSPPAAEEPLPKIALPPGEGIVGTAHLVRELAAQAAGGPAWRGAWIPIGSRLLDRERYPLPAFLALRAANDTLSGAAVRKDVPELFSPPVRSMVFEKGGERILALWSTEGEVEQELLLGENAEAFPPLGRVEKLAPGERRRIGPMPLFIAKVDTSLLESRLSLQLYDPLDPSKPDPTLPLRADPTRRLLRFRNASRQKPITALRVKIQDPLPPDWVVRPLSSTVDSLPARKEISQEIAFTLPQTESERLEDLALELSFVRDGREQVIRKVIPVRIVSPIGVAVDVSDVPTRRNAKRVAVKVTNGTPRRVNLFVTVRLPNLPEQLEPLGQVPPGGSPERRLEYLVPDAHLIDPTRLQVEVICEERGGERLFVRKVIPLR